jgi:hypothetical protein
LILVDLFKNISMYICFIHRESRPTIHLMKVGYYSVYDWIQLSHISRQRHITVLRKLTLMFIQYFEGFQPIYTLFSGCHLQARV